MIAGVVILHIWALHVPGNNNPTGVNVKSIKELHGDGPKFSETNISTAKDLLGPKGKDFTFRFGGNVYGKPANSGWWVAEVDGALGRDGDENGPQVVVGSKDRHPGHPDGQRLRRVSITEGGPHDAGSSLETRSVRPLVRDAGGRR